MGLDAIAGALGSKALDWVDTAVQYYNQKKLNRQAQKDTQQNMQLQKELNLQQLIDSYPSSVAGMRRAGLNPALAVGGVGSAQGVSSFAGNAGLAAKPDNSAPAALEAATALAQQESQIDLNKAAAEKARAEAEEVRKRTPNYGKTGKLLDDQLNLNRAQKDYLDSLFRKTDNEALLVGNEFSRRASEDSAISKLMVNEALKKADAAQSQKEKDAWLTLSDELKSADLGVFMALGRYAQYVNDLGEYDRQAVLRRLSMTIANMQLSEGSILSSIASLPVAQIELMMAQIADLGESRAYKQALRELEVPASAELKEQQSKTMLHNDFVGNVGAGRYGDAALNLLPDVLHLAEEAVFLRYLGRGAGNSAVPPFRPGYGPDKPFGSPSTTKVPPFVQRVLNKIGKTGKVPANLTPEEKRALENYYKGEYDY